MNIFFGVLALIFCTYLGYRTSLKYVKRKNFFNDFAEFNKKLKNEVLFLQNTLVKITDKIDDGNDFNTCIKEYVKNKKYGFELNYLSADEKEFFDKYLGIIGKGDKTSQLQYLNSVDEKISALYVSASSEEKKFKTLYVKLGFLIGLMALVLLL